MKITDHIDIGIKVIATFIAAFGIWKYFHEREVEKAAFLKEQSLKVVSEYSSNGMLSARRELMDFWRSQPEFASYISSVEVVGANEYSNFVRIVLPAHDKYEEIVEALFIMNDFFDNAYHCRAAGLCDDHLLDKFMCSKVKDYEVVYSPFFAVLNRSMASSDFGKSLEGYSRDCHDEM